MSEALQSFLAGEGAAIARQLAAQAGLTEQTASKVMNGAAPVILGALKKTISREGGQQALQAAVAQMASGNLFQNLAGLLGGAGAAGTTQASASAAASPWAGIVTSLLGDAVGKIAAGLQTKFKIDQAQATQAVTLLAPVVLGALMQKQGGANFEAIRGLIDRDGDGEIMDDIAGFLDKSGGGGGGGGLFGSLLGALGGRKA